MRTNLMSCFFFVLFAVAVCPSHAEGGCPPGMIPANGTNANSCVPIPPGYYQEQQVSPLASGPIWADRYGAIATDFSHSSAGASVNKESRGEAEQAAIAECRSNGGVNCNVEISYGNGCVSLAIGKTGHNAKAGPSIASASRSAMDVCNAADTECSVYYSACSPPERVQ